MAITNGHILRVYNSGTALTNETSCTVSLEKDMRQIAHKDTAGTGTGYEENLPGQKRGTISAEGFFEDANTNGFEALWSAFDADTALTILVGTSESGTEEFSGTAYITRLEQTAPDNENVTWSADFVFSGAVTRPTAV